MPDLDGLLGWIACIADAQPTASYVAQLEFAGLTVNHTEGHDEALSELISQVRHRLLAAEVLTKIQHVDLPRGVDLQVARGLARSAADSVKAGTLGYALIVASRDSSLP